MFIYITQRKFIQSGQENSICSKVAQGTFNDRNIEGLQIKIDKSGF